MTELKLARLPDRNPVKLAIAVMPDLHSALLDYAAIYAERYGQQEALPELIPAMLETFIASDRGFAKAREAMRSDQSRK
ncbi:DUF2274 domain-containing protein [Rhizorhabdus dicambivorans]|uniref:DUF2274 domain-containing protein n=1 Tax=Rhizorhabdus dicambivorans TaxID=1850238 RepID=A0A2A4FSG2_9SPHN|nr:DUF2274 domain-containing protein [Rhizorhabdus dicambivorans]ATE66370.1 DUF2274 domain-containing protein [Rhizorhabdus dicambivorans]PCE40388.1 DUF2274 domain-containing protein [Rhizorhabdus dicambivorans]